MSIVNGIFFHQLIAGEPHLVMGMEQQLDPQRIQPTQFLDKPWDSYVHNFWEPTEICLILREQ
jgi:hypothetical protein